MLLLWLYLTALVILIGGAINAIFDDFSGINQENKDRAQQRSEDKTANAPLGDAMQKQPDADIEPTTEKSKRAASKNGNTTSGESDGGGAAKRPAEERTYGKMIFGGILGGLISFLSKKKK